MTVKRLIIALFFACEGTALYADWHLDASTGAFYDSNLSHSNLERDERDDWAWKTNLHVGFGTQLTDDLRFNISGEVESKVWARFEAFNEVAPGMSANFRYRFGLGRLAPWIMLEEKLRYREFDESDRSGWNQQFGIRAGKGLTDWLALETDFLVEHFSANNSFFDQSSKSGSIRLTFDMTSSAQIAVGYRYRYGDVISYAIPPRPDILALAAAVSPTMSFEIPYMAYNLKASTHTLLVAFNYIVNDFVAFQLSYENSYTSHKPLDYVNHLVEAKISFSY